MRLIIVLLVRCVFFPIQEEAPELKSNQTDAHKSNFFHHFAFSLQMRADAHTHLVISLLSLSLISQNRNHKMRCEERIVVCVGRSDDLNNGLRAVGVIKESLEMRFYMYQLITRTVGVLYILYGSRNSVRALYKLDASIKDRRICLRGRVTLLTL